MVTARSAVCKPSPGLSVRTDDALAGTAGTLATRARASNSARTPGAGQLSARRPQRNNMLHAPPTGLRRRPGATPASGMWCFFQDLVGNFYVRWSPRWPCRHGKVQWLSLENFMGNAPPGPGMGQGALVKRRDPGCHRRGLSRHRRACEDATADWGIDGDPRHRGRRGG